MLGGVGPAVMSTLAIADDVEAGALRQIDVDGLDMQRILRAVWSAPISTDRRHNCSSCDSAIPWSTLIH